MKRLIAKVLPGLIVAVIMTVIGGLLDMRMTLARLETKSDAMNARVERIERHIDESEAKMGMLETE